MAEPQVHPLGDLVDEEKGLKEADPKPCSHCPWRRANQGTRHPHGWYSKKNLRRLWSGLRSGKAPGMSCHPTDPNNEVPEGHGTPAPDGNQPTECAGALIMVQRELRRFEAESSTYLKTRKRGLTREGLLWWGVSRCSMAGTPFGGPSMPLIKDDDPDIGFDWIDET